MWNAEQVDVGVSAFYNRRLKSGPSRRISIAGAIARLSTSAAQYSLSRAGTNWTKFVLGGKDPRMGAPAGQVRLVRSPVTMHGELTRRHLNSSVRDFIKRKYEGRAYVLSPTVPDPSTLEEKGSVTLVKDGKLTPVMLTRVYASPTKWATDTFQNCRGAASAQAKVPEQLCGVSIHTQGD